MKVVGTLRQQLPKTKILLLGILPRTGVTNFDQIVKINENISRSHDGKNMFFLDMFNKFSSEVWGGRNGVIIKNVIKIFFYVVVYLTPCFMTDYI